MATRQWVWLDKGLERGRPRREREPSLVPDSEALRWEIPFRLFAVKRPEVPKTGE